MKKVPATYITIREIEFDLDVDVLLLASRIFTTTDLSTIVPHHETEKEKKYLCISIEIQLDGFESISDGAAYARPRLLILLGILSFLTQELFTPFQFYRTSTLVGNLKQGGERNLSTTN
ncbi:MAG: hypothetical protein NXH90_15225 [Flavobacteriaceae bacterium]|nr:hypothetical protein [Flavobacteriaceae bacterium]